MRGFLQYQTTCSKCQGQGQSIKDPCPVCTLVLSISFKQFTLVSLLSITSIFFDVLFSDLFRAWQRPRQPVYFTRHPTWSANSQSIFRVYVRIFALHHHCMLIGVSDGVRLRVSDDSKLSNTVFVQIRVRTSPVTDSDTSSPGVSLPFLLLSLSPTRCCPPSLSSSNYSYHGVTLSRLARFRT